MDLRSGRVLRTHRRRKQGTEVARVVGWHPVTPIPNTPGIGLRLAHLTEMVATRPRAGWLEIHPENFLANPHAAELLVELAANYPISVHTVGISVGSAGGLDPLHLSRTGRLAGQIKPTIVSV